MFVFRKILIVSTALFLFALLGCDPNESAGTPPAVSWQKLDIAPDSWVNTNFISGIGLIATTGAREIKLSTDNGETWVSIKGDIEDQGNSTYFVREVLGGALDNLYARTNYGALYRSNNLGDTWQVMPLDHFSTTGDYFVSSSQKDLLVTQNISFLSVDGGENWSRRSVSPPPVYGNYRGIIADAAGKSVMLETGMGTYRSPDWGISWELLSQFSERAQFTDFARATDGTLYGLFLEYPHNQVKFWTVYRSEDDGASWKRLNIGAESKWPYHLAVNQNEDLFVSATYDLIRYAGETGTVDNLTAGLPKTQSIQLTIDDEGYLYAGTKEGLFRSVDPTTY